MTELEDKAIKHVCSSCGHFERTGKITCDSKCECFHFYIDGVKKMQEENEQMKAQIEKMKCCGNCKYRKLEVIETCREKKTYTLNKGFCDKWELAE